MIFFDTPNPDNRKFIIATEVTEDTEKNEAISPGKF
jgi:hypothetical protein